MSTMPEIVDAIARAFGNKDLKQVRGYLIQAASKLGDERGERIRAHLGMQAVPKPDASGVRTMQPLPMRNGESAWRKAPIGRSAFVPERIHAQLQEWREEAKYASALAAAGERTLPLLLVGPTRCGKTSSASALATYLERELYCLRSSDVVASYMGETAKRMRAAFDEMDWIFDGLFLIDEIDGLTPQRGGGISAEAKERNHTVACLLTWLESFPQHVVLIATTNRLDAIDTAVAARFKVIVWPEWTELCDYEKDSFYSSHVGRTARAESIAGYAQAVEEARRQRVAAVIGAAKSVDSQAAE